MLSPSPWALSLRPTCCESATPPPRRPDGPSLFRDGKGGAPMDLHKGELEPTPPGADLMSALPMIRDWRQQVRDELLPDLHGHQANALADLSFAMALCRHCHSGQL